MRPRARLLGLITIAMLAGACGARGTASDAPSQRFDPATATALAYLYRDTVAVVVVRSPTLLDRQVGWDAAAAVFGIDLSLADLEAAGVDLDAPIGAAAIDLAAGTFAVFADVRDPDRALRWIEARALASGVPMTRSVSAGAEILLPGDSTGVAIVRRDRSLILITTAGPPSVRDLAAVRVASLESGDSIAETEAFLRVMPEVAATSTVVAYIDFERLGTAMVAPTSTEMQVREMIGEYERRRRTTTGQDRIAIDRQLDVLRSITAATSRQRRLTTDLFAALGGAALAAEVEPAGHLSVELVASPAPGTLPDRLLGSEAHSPKLAGAIEGRPLLLIEASPEPSALLELMDLWLAARGADRGSIDAVVKQETGRDLRRDLYDNLSGPVGCAITSHGNLGLEPEMLRKDLELSITVGVRHRDRIEGLLAAVGDEPEGATMDWPGFKPLHLVALGNELIATTDQTTVEKLGRARAAATESAAYAHVVIDGWLIALLTGSDPVVPRKVEHSSTADPRLVADLERAEEQLARQIASHARATLQRRVEMGGAIGRLMLQVQRPGSLTRARGHLELAGSPRETVAIFGRSLSTHRAALERDRAAEQALRATIERLAEKLTTETPTTNIQQAPN